MARIRPQSFVHIVYRTYRFAEMLAWYQGVFGARVQLKNPALAFLTWDDEHHRLALANLAVLKPDFPEKEKMGITGVDHVAYTYASLDDLFENYAQLKAEGIEPYWCVHHGLTVSMYYADPDGNQMEFQVEVFDSSEEAGSFMCGPVMANNPVGVEFDPEEWLAAKRAGRPLSDFLVRKVHEPASPIRGDLASPDG
jgi:catechol 2,3-dioxygenase-like lactoylglutathione lyase family enzyme